MWDTTLSGDGRLHHRQTSGPERFNQPMRTPSLLPGYVRVMVQWIISPDGKQCDGYIVDAPLSPPPDEPVLVGG